MQNIKEHLTTIMSQIIAMEKENEKLKEIIERQVKSYDTDTHILVEKEVLSNIADKMDTIVCDADSSSGYCETIEDEVSNAKYYAEECSSVAYNLRDKLEEILKPKKEGENDEK
tara:strand:+ start:725 stop:1066 length:342 start_codon:yes stop_codon:yes gene_type:complete